MRRHAAFKTVALSDTVTAVEKNTIESGDDGKNPAVENDDNSVDSSAAEDSGGAAPTSDGVNLNPDYSSGDSGLRGIDPATVPRETYNGILAAADNECGGKEFVVNPYSSGDVQFDVIENTAHIGGYCKGSIDSGMLFLRYENGSWNIEKVGGQSAFDCSEVDNEGWPTEIVGKCVDDNLGKLRNVKY
jgi:hypothetical protein